eukprot:Stramenopile-MAST_4_protein_6021
MLLSLPRQRCTHFQPSKLFLRLHLKKWKSSASAALAAKKRLGLALPALDNLCSRKDRECELEQSLMGIVEDCRQEKILFLGLDISTRVSGYGLLDANGVGVCCSAIKTSAVDVVDIGNEISTFLSSRVDPILSSAKYSDYELNIIFEDCMTSFSPGKFNARGLMKLAQVNGVARYAVWSRYGIRPSLIHPSAARHFFQLMRATEQKKEPVKERVFNYVTAYAPDLPWLDQGKGVAYDKTDAYLVAMYARAMYFKKSILSSADMWEKLGVHPSILQEEGRGPHRKLSMEILDKAVMEWLKHRRRDVGLGLD